MEIGANSDSLLLYGRNPSPISLQQIECTMPHSFCAELRTSN